ncbi:MAG: rod-binding protein [Beijerinckiaceae bacterium]
MGPVIAAAAAALSAYQKMRLKPPAAQLSAAPGLNGLDPKTDARLKKTARDFESMFLENMVDKMFGSLGEDGPLGADGAGGDVWRSMLAKEHAQSLTRAGGIGMAASVYGELVKIQAQATAAGKGPTG